MPSPASVVHDAGVPRTPHQHWRTLAAAQPAELVARRKALPALATAAR